MTKLYIALIGDHNPSHLAHEAIPKALNLAAASLACSVEPTWIHTSTLGEHTAFQLEGFDGVWCVPGSPYANMAGVLRAIQAVREGTTPFLGTCGGFQHAVIEFARNVLRLDEADHAESAPNAPTQVISPLSCSLVERDGEILLGEGSRLRAACGAPAITERYHCRFGVNSAFVAALRDGGLNLAGFDREGDLRAIEISQHPFFVATLFQPERSALEDRAHPLIKAFLDASMSRA